MLEYLYLARWNDALGFLASGSPPVYLRLVAVNAFFVALFGLRQALDVRPMGEIMLHLVRFTVLAANLAVLFQPQVESYLLGLTSRF